MIKVGIVGISGYSGVTALEILLKHPKVRVTYVSANQTSGKVEDIWPKLKGQCSLSCSRYQAEKAVKACDVIFLAVPHTVAMGLAPELLKSKMKIIDLSADYRLPEADHYQKFYETVHKDQGNLKNAVYGLPELYRTQIKKAILVANPGCYPTAAILGCAPIMATYSNTVEQIIIDAKSGVSGAGKKLSESLMFCEVNDNFKAYKVLNHQHIPEIEHYLSRLAGKDFPLTFVPHLLPVNRGILATIYISLNKKMSYQQVYDLYQKFYKTEPFVRVLKPNEHAELKNVAYTNFCDIGISVDENKKLLIITSAIDNLLKGAAGQAVQNMNIMHQFEETTGLL